MSTTAVTPEAALAALPLEELRRLTIQAESTPPVVPDPAPVVPVADPATDPPAPKRFRREVDIGDGSGKQVFEGATLDELVNNLAKAQENATRKIREQAAQLKANEKPATAPKPPTAEERLAALEARIAWQNTAAEFVGKHPDYENTQANATKIERYMAAQGLPRTLEGLDQAFNELSESGLLSGKPAPTGEPTNTDPQRIAAPAVDGTSGKSQPSSSGLSARAGSLAQRAAKEEITAEDLKKMDLSELRARTKEYLGS